MRQIPQPPAPHAHPRPPGIPPTAPPMRSYAPPTPPLPHRYPLAMPGQQGLAPHPQHPLAPHGNPWGPYGFAAPMPRNARRRTALKLWLRAAGVAIAAVVGVVGFWAPGLFVTKQLDVISVQADVTRILSDPAGYRARSVSDVACNDGQNPIIAKGGTFICQATIDHIKHQFLITFTDDEGSYEISAPKGTKI